MININPILYKNEYTGFELSIPNLFFEPGKLYLIKGSNGSGKTTFAKLLSGDIKSEISQKSVIYLDQNTDSNIFFDLKFTEHLHLNENKQLLNEFRSFFKIPNNLIGKYPDELSGGEKQLLAFLTIILSDKDIYIFDEIFNHLDNKTQISIILFIKEILIKKMKKIIIIVAHKTQDIEKDFDFILEVFGNKVKFI